MNICGAVREVIVHCCIFRHSENSWRCANKRFTDGLASIVYNANSEQCSFPILFPMEGVRSDAALLCGIGRDRALRDLGTGAAVRHASQSESPMAA